MKKSLMALAFFLQALWAQGQEAAADSTFHAYIYNEEYQVYMDINFYANDVSVPGQDIFGKTPGYFGAVRDSRKWLVTDAKITAKGNAELCIVNDYGSEDLTATLEYDKSEKAYVLRQTGGSRLKIVVNRKWVKLPAVLKFVPHSRIASKW